MDQNQHAASAHQVHIWTRYHLVATRAFLNAIRAIYVGLQEARSIKIELRNEKCMFLGANGYTFFLGIGHEVWMFRALRQLTWS